MASISRHFSGFFKTKDKFSVKELREGKTVIKEGWLRKRSSNKITKRVMASMNMKWQNFYVVLTTDSIVYFKSECEKSCCGKIALFGYNAVCAISAENQSGWPENSFRIMHACSDHSGSQVIYFATTETNDRKVWMKSIKQALMVANEAVVKRLKDKLYDDEDIEQPIYEISDWTAHIANADEPDGQSEGSDIESDEDDYERINEFSKRPPPTSKWSDTISSQGSSTYHDPEENTKFAPLLKREIKHPPLPSIPLPQIPSTSKPSLHHKTSGGGLLAELTQRQIDIKPNTFSYDTPPSHTRSTVAPMLPPGRVRNQPERNVSAAPRPRAPPENMNPSYGDRSPPPQRVPKPLPMKPLPDLPNGGARRPIMPVKPTLSKKAAPLRSMYWPGEKMEAQRMMQESAEGCFMIRASDRDPGSMVLMIAEGNSQVFSMKIYHPTQDTVSLKRLDLVEPHEIFPNISDLIEYYRKNDVLLRDGQLRIKLVEPHYNCRDRLS